MIAHTLNVILSILVALVLALAVQSCEDPNNDRRRADVARICGDPAANCGCWAQYGYDTCP